MKTTIKTVVIAATVLAAGIATAAQTGSYLGKAKSLKASQSVTLVNEYDKEEKEYMDSGVYYLTTTLKRGGAYTVWITGGSVADIDLDVDTNWDYYDDREDEPSASFEVIDYGNTKAAFLYADDWDEEDPSSGKFVVTLSGDIGAGTMLYYQQGTRSFSQVGDESTPRVISPGSSWKSYYGSLLEGEESGGEYNFRASLKAGRMYRVRTDLGTKSAPLSLSIDALSESVDYQEDVDIAYSNKIYDASYVVVPETSGKFNFSVEGNDGQRFRLYYKAVSPRAIGAHPSIPLVEENGYEARFVPGRMSTSYNYYDSIVDEGLCKIYLNKGEKWVFETSGASVNQQMLAYNPAGKILSSVESMGELTGGGTNYDTRVVIKASASGVYYIGVCEDGLDVDGTPSGAPVTLSARNASTFVPADSYDPADDVWTGASELVPYPAATNVSAVAATMTNDAAIALGAVHGPHRLDAADLYDVFALPCRVGYTYKIRANFLNDSDTSPYTLGFKVYTPNGTGERDLTTAYKNNIFGSLSPVPGVYVADDELTFQAKTNAVHYIRVWVADAVGLDFPSYTMHATCSRATSAKDALGEPVYAGLGFVKVVSRGADGTWSIGTEKYTYPSGTTLSLVSNNAVVVKANAVSGFTAPAARPVAVPLWNDGDAILTVTNKYSDIYDRQYVRYTYKKTVTKNGKKTTSTVSVKSPATGDDTEAGAFILTPKNAVQTARRTLWTEDAADWFCFNNTSSNIYYNFAIESTLDGEDGDAVFVISSKDGTYESVATNSVERLILPAGTNYVKVVHADSGAPVDSAYALRYSKAASGLVNFASKKTTTAKKNGKTVTTTTYSAFAGCKTPSYTAKESDGYAYLYLTRNGSEGSLRVRYATQAGTAVPAKNYYPVTDGEVSWAAGDKSVKTVQIRLMPELVSEWEGTNRTFTVKLYAVDEYDLADGEYLSQIPVEEAVVTLTEASTKLPGTVSLASYIYEDGAAEEVSNAVANVKKPAVQGTAGKTVDLVFERTGGADGPVSVKVASLTTAAQIAKYKDTAKAGVDFTAVNETISWEDGDAEPRVVTVTLAGSANYAATKKFTLLLSKVKTDGTLPTLSATTATVTILNDTVAQTAAAYAKTIASSTGLALATTGTWFNDYDGTLRSASADGTVTFTLAGPGFFRAMPQVVLGGGEGAAATLTCSVVTKNGKKTTFTRTDDCSAFTAGTDELAYVLGAGTTTVKFTLSGVAGGAYVKFVPQSGAPYLWEKFANVSPVSPMNKAVVFADAAKLAWSAPESLAGVDGLKVRVRFGTDAKAATVVTSGAASLLTEAAMPEALVPGKTYYWALDWAYGDDPTDWIAGAAAWSFSAMAANAPVVRFSSGTDAADNDLTESVTGGVSVVMLQGVRPYEFLLDDGGEGESPDVLQNTRMYRKVAGALPTGLSVNETTGAITGVPTKVGTYTALLQAYDRRVASKKKVNGKWKYTYAYVYGATLPVTFEVLPAGTSVGSFRGVLAEDGSTLETNSRRLGFVTLTATSAGKLTAKVLIAGSTYTFTATGYDECVSYDADSAGVSRTLSVRLKNTVTIAKKKYYNYLDLTMGDGDVTNTVALAKAAGSAELTMNTTAKAVLADPVTYLGDIYRSNGGTDAGKEGFAPFAGYYTVSIVPEDVTAADGVPVGNGYLTFTIADSGSVKVTGVLADGTAVSGSTIAQAIGDDASADFAKDCVLRIPFLVSKSTYAVGGVAEIAYEDPAADGALPVAMPSAKLVWVKNAAKTTSADATAFAISLAPTGGWYDKVVNLQAYYLNREFAVSAATEAESLPAAALAKGYSFTTASTPNDLEVTFAGNALSVAKRVLVKNKTTGLYDFGDSVNPWNTSVKFTRATGIVTGSFYAWDWIYKSDLSGFEYATAQKATPLLTHKGVLLYSRDSSSESPLADNVLTSGFFLMPATTSTAAKTRKSVWSASLPFNIVTTSDDEKDWSEKDFSEGE